MNKSISVLIIEDEKELCDVIEMGLKSYGFNGTIYKARSLEESVEILKKNAIGLFIIDWMLPDGEGIDLVRKLRTFKQYENTPMIMMTGRDDIASRTQFNSLKLRSMLVKPFSLEELKVEILLNLKAPEETPITIPFDTKFLIIDDQLDLVEIIAEQLVRDGYKNIDKAFSFLEASKKLEKDSFSFLITDWALKDGTGLDLIHNIRKNPKYQKLPILLITGKDGIDDLMMLHELNIKDHLIKPFQFKELKGKLLECWERIHIKNAP